MNSINPKILASEAADILNNSLQNIHKKLKTMNLPTEKSQNRVYFSHNTSRQLFNFNWQPKVFSFQLVKGGVGKTAISLMFAVRSALLGARVALIEIDQQANLTRSFKIDASDKPIMIDIITNRLKIKDCMINVIDGLDLLPSRVDNALLDNILLLGKHPLDRVFAEMINQIKPDYDIIILDCPPSIGAAVTSTALASDVIVMPVNPTDYSVAGLELTFREVKEITERYAKNIEIRIVFNKYDARTSLSFNTISQLIKHPDFGSRMVSSYIRSSQAIENCISNGKTVFDSIRNSPEREDFSTITKELLGI